MNNTTNQFYLEEYPEKYIDNYGKEHDPLTIQVYAIYDAAAELYKAPMLFRNLEVAKRSFNALVVPGSDLYQFAEDFSLVFLGEFDEREGKYYRSVYMPIVVEAKEVKEEYERKIQESGTKDESTEKS